MPASHTRCNSARIVALLCLLGVGMGAVIGCEMFSEPGHEDWSPPAGAAERAELAPRAPCADREPLKRAFFGDLHVHTAYSMDAQAWGLPLTPDDAYRYARGEQVALPAVGVASARRLSIDRPLDFAAVTDHAEWMAEVAVCTTPGSASYDSHGCRVYRGEASWWVARVLRLDGFAARVAGIAGFRRRSREVCGEDARQCRAAAVDIWRATRAAAERWYDRTPACSFTTFHAWEYSQTPANSKVHRNVILRNEIVPELPISWIDAPEPEELRRKLRLLCTENGSGCDAIAIPHNPNLANGRMFVPSYRDLPLEQQRQQARIRAELEPLVEIMQIKGESECRNGLYGVVGGPDELCDFEKKRDLPGERFEDCEEGIGEGGQGMSGCISRLDYARYALLEGLREKERIGVNPYAFGFIGSTDTHMATPGGVAEWGEGAPLGRAGRASGQQLEPGRDVRESVLWHNPGGLVGLWAEDNSRDALFDALRRREAFATSGPRIRPRLFAGFELPPDICERTDFAAAGYAAGVPMGADLPAPGRSDGRPRFAVAALRDPGTAARPGGLLQRIQIVKGWVDDEGLFHQRVIEIAGDPRNGASVEPDSCDPIGPGASSLCGVWQDDAFDPDRAAVYYARVVENPGCRWSSWQCLALAADARPDGCSDPRVPRTIQERAWTSPVWYTP